MDAMSDRLAGPITVVSNALRGLVLGQGALPPGRTITGQVALALLWAAAITAVFAPLAVRSYRRTSANPRQQVSEMPSSGLLTS
jgi:hypothetical protein